MNNPQKAIDGSVAVLMPVHNAERYLNEAIESILSQTFKNFQLIIVNDASSDSSWSIIEGFNDSRIIKIHLIESKGIVNALNIALEVTNTEFVARMDADDIARNDRFEKQVGFLESHPEVGVCGSSINMNKNGLSCYVQYPQNHDQILCSLAIYKRSICHPTVMIRRAVINRYKKQYSQEYLYAEDLFLWHDLVTKTRFYNLNEPLLTYRMHTGQVSSCYKEEQINQTRALLNRTLPKYFPSLSSRIHNDLLRLVTPESNHNEHGIEQIDIANLYYRMIRANLDDKLSAPAIFDRILLSKLLEVIFKRYLGLRNTSFVIFKVFHKNPRLLLNDVNRFVLYIRHYLRAT